MSPSPALSIDLLGGFHQADNRKLPPSTEHDPQIEVVKHFFCPKGHGCLMAVRKRFGGIKVLHTECTFCLREELNSASLLMKEAEELECMRDVLLTIVSDLEDLEAKFEAIVANKREMPVEPLK